MSVELRAPIVPRMWRGYDDAGLPEGAYIGNTVSLGDVSGGTNSILFEFKRDSEAVSGRYYNLEQLNIFTTNTLTQLAFLQIRNFEQLGPFQIGQRDWTMLLSSSPNSVSSMSFADTFPGLFLGQVSRVANIGSLLEIGVNNVNGVLVAATVQGYVWGARSNLAEGGLRRPVESLYGR